MRFKEFINEGWIETSKTEYLKKYLQDVKGIRQKTKLAIEAELRKRQGQRQENNSENGLEITDKNINISEPIENLESVDTVKLHGKIYELTAPITAYKFDHHEASNSYYGSSRIHKAKYKPIQLKVGDRFTVLHQVFYLLEPGKKLSRDDLIKFDNYEKGEFEKSYIPWWKPIPKARKEIK